MIHIVATVSFVILCAVAVIMLVCVGAYVAGAGIAAWRNTLASEREQSFDAAAQRMQHQHILSRQRRLKRRAKFEKARSRLLPLLVLGVAAQLARMVEEKDKKST